MLLLPGDSDADDQDAHTDHDDRRNNRDNHVQVQPLGHPREAPVPHIRVVGVFGKRGCQGTWEGR